jgi:hypothetical protein
MKAAIALTMLLIIPMTLNAATVEFVSSVPLSHTDWDEILELTRFDPAQGTLINAEVTLDAGFEGTFFFENTGGSAGSYHGEMDWDMEIILPGAVTVILFDEFITTDGDLEAYDGTLDFDGPSGDTIPISADMDPMSLFAAEELSFFIGTGTIDLPISSDALVFLQAFYGSGSMGSTSFAFAELTVTYTYEEEVAVQESSWSSLKQLY